MTKSSSVSSTSTQIREFCLHGRCRCVVVSAIIQEAMEQREHAQKAALEALRNASATDNVVRIYKYG
jgi:hypothetical protein